MLLMKNRPNPDYDDDDDDGDVLTTCDRCDTDFNRDDACETMDGGKLCDRCGDSEISY
jgi:hypothetical protein